MFDFNAFQVLCDKFSKRFFPLRVRFGTGENASVGDGRTSWLIAAVAAERKAFFETSWGFPN